MDFFTFMLIAGLVVNTLLAGFFSLLWGSAAPEAGTTFKNVLTPSLLVLYLVTAITAMGNTDPFAVAMLPTLFGIATPLAVAAFYICRAPRA